MSFQNLFVARHPHLKLFFNCHPWKKSCQFSMHNEICFELIAAVAIASCHINIPSDDANVDTHVTLLCLIAHQVFIIGENIETQIDGMNMARAFAYRADTLLSIESFSH